MTYSKEFKQQAIKLSDEIGTQKACEQLGLVYFTLVNQRINRSRTERKDENGKHDFQYSLVETFILAYKRM